MLFKRKVLSVAHLYQNILRSTAHNFCQITVIEIKESLENGASYPLF